MLVASLGIEDLGLRSQRDSRPPVDIITGLTEWPRSNQRCLPHPFEKTVAARRAWYSRPPTENAAALRCWRFVWRTGIDVPLHLRTCSSSTAWQSTLESRPQSLVHSRLKLQPQGLGGELHLRRHLSTYLDEIVHQLGAESVKTRSAPFSDCAEGLVPACADHAQE